MDYQIIAVTSAVEGSAVRVGDRLLIASELRATFEKETGISGADTLWSGKGDALAGTVSAHPLRGKGYDFDVPMISPAGSSYRAGPRRR
jgi:isoleucyl-tRNA synthetase